MKVYRVHFMEKGNPRCLTAKNITHNRALMGFLEVSDFVFQAPSQIINDPEFEKLQDEFSKLKCTYLPMSKVIRVDYLDMEEALVTNVPAVTLPEASPAAKPEEGSKVVALQHYQKKTDSD